MHKAIFFDRDGTFIKDRHFISDPDDVSLFPRVKDTVKKLKKMGFMIIVVTNQSGIARGYFTVDDMMKVNKRLNELLDGVIDDFFFCPHHPDITGTCSCRKPGIEMILDAKEKYDLYLSECFMVGDKMSDYLAGKNAGLKNSYLIMSGYGRKEYEKYSSEYDISVLEDISELLGKIS